MYYLPDSPRIRIRRDGEPEMSLLKYRLDPALTSVLGAGLLSLTVDLGVEQERLDRLRRRVARDLTLNSRVSLSPVSCDARYISLQATISMLIGLLPPVRASLDPTTDNSGSSGCLPRP